MEHRLETSFVLAAPIDEAFGFFADAENLERITPAKLRFLILSPRPIRIRAGATIDYRLVLFGVPIRWQSVISVWDPPHRFVDEQTRGPYRQWIHTHRFESVDCGTRISDDVRYRLPLSPVGDLAYPLVRAQLRSIFDYRERAMRRLLTGEETS